MIKVHFGESDNAKYVETELLDIMSVLQDVSLRLVNVSHRIKFEDTKGRLQGYADVIRLTGGNICELFEFYK